MLSSNNQKQGKDVCSYGTRSCSHCGSQEKEKAYIFVDDIIAYVENSKESIKNKKER